MKRLISSLAVVVAVVALAGCAGAGKSGLPCEDCRYGVQSVGKAQPPRIFCVVNGKEVDCRKDPSGCQECAKSMK